MNTNSGWISRCFYKSVREKCSTLPVGPIIIVLFSSLIFSSEFHIIFTQHCQDAYFSSRNLHESKFQVKNLIFIARREDFFFWNMHDPFFHIEFPTITAIQHISIETYVYSTVFCQNLILDTPYLTEKEDHKY